MFGYKDNSGISYRFFNKVIYPVLNPGENIILYKTVHTSGGIKNPQTLINFYYSKDAYSPVTALTIPNLEKTFSDNKLFQEFLDIHFKQDDELSEYDDTHKMYKINRLLELSQSQK